MYDPGYTDYKDGRLQPPELPDPKACGNCEYYRDVAHTQSASGMTHYIAVCVKEVFDANGDLKRLAKAELETVDPDEEPCDEYLEVQ